MVSRHRELLLCVHSRDVPIEMTLQIKEKFVAARRRNQHARRVRYPTEMSDRVS